MYVCEHYIAIQLCHNVTSYAPKTCMISVKVARSYIKLNII